MHMELDPGRNLGHIKLPGMIMERGGGGGNVDRKNGLFYI